MFISKNLSVLAYANGFTLWHYQTPDPLQEVTAPGYWNAAHGTLCKGDQIFITATVERVAHSAHLAVLAVDEEWVTVATLGRV